MTDTLKKIPDSDIVAYDAFSELFPIRVDVVYGRSDHPENNFGQIYHPAARMLGHRDMVKTVLLAARSLNDCYGWTLIVKDCLRPIEAQAKMVETPIVKANPHWIEEPRFLSSPGQGGHPRGMAVDLDAVDHNGVPVDFGTCFDHFSSATDKDVNPAHREHPNLSAHALSNRSILTKAMAWAAAQFGLPMLPLPQEWWDFRFPRDYTNQFAPISDRDLRIDQKMMVEPQGFNNVPDEKILRDLKAVTQRPCLESPPAP